MAYSVQADLLMQISETELIELTDDAGAGAVDDDVVDRAIADADEEIDAYVGVKYSLPFDSTPGLIRRMSVDLAVCNLYARRDDTIPAYRKERCDAHRKLLEKIALGQLKLDAADPDQDSDFGVKTTSDKDDRIFSIGRGSDNSSGSLDNY